MKVPSKASTISYVDKSTEKSVPVTVSSEMNTMVESSTSSEVQTGSGSSSFGSSTVYKPTLVSSSTNVPVTSCSKKFMNGSSATTVGTTVITYSQSEISNKGSNGVVNKPTANTATTRNAQNTTVINNNHSANQGEVTVTGNNNNNGNNAQAGQGNKTGKDNGNGQDEGLPQTGEAAAATAVGLGITLIAISGIVVLEKKN